MSVLRCLVTVDDTHFTENIFGHLRQAIDSALAPYCLQKGDAVSLESSSLLHRCSPVFPIRRAVPAVLDFFLGGMAKSGGS